MTAIRAARERNRMRINLDAAVCRRVEPRQQSQERFNSPQIAYVGLHIQYLKYRKCWDFLVFENVSMSERM